MTLGSLILYHYEMLVKVSDEDNLMESHLIEYAINHKQWKPIKINRNWPNLFNLFFDDDLILFAEADITQIKVIQACLDFFCKASRERVNIGKTHLFFSRNVYPNVATEISQESGFALVVDLGKYLDIPLHHSRVNSRTFQYLE